MKKLLTTLLLFNLLAINISALETRTITFNYEVAPTYSILLPKKLDVSHETSILTYEVKGDIYGDQLLKIVFASNINLTNGSKTIVANINQDKDSYSYQELSNEYISSSIEIAHAKLSSGKWSGQLNVSIYLEDQ